MSLEQRWRDALVQNAVPYTIIYRHARQTNKHEGSRLCLEDEDASDKVHVELLRELFSKFGPKCFFFKLKCQFISDCPQIWDAVTDTKHPVYEESLSGLKTSKARHV